MSPSQMSSEKPSEIIFPTLKMHSLTDLKSVQDGFSQLSEADKALFLQQEAMKMGCQIVFGGGILGTRNNISADVVNQIHCGQDVNIVDVLRAVARRADP